MWSESYISILCSYKRKYISPIDFSPALKHPTVSLGEFLPYKILSKLKVHFSPSGVYLFFFSWTTAPLFFDKTWQLSIPAKLRSGCSWGKMKTWRIFLKRMAQRACSYPKGKNIFPTFSMLISAGLQPPKCDGFFPASIFYFLSTLKEMYLKCINLTYGHFERLPQKKVFGALCKSFRWTGLNTNAAGV